MTRTTRARWGKAAVLLALGVAATAVLLLLELTVPAMFAALLAAGLAGLAAFLRPRSTASHWEAQQRLVRDGIAIVYWRPGCWWCRRLRWWLGPAARDATWVDAWADDAAAAFVRDINGGRERLPLVILESGDALVRPDPRALRRLLAPPGRFTSDPPVAA